MGKKTAAATARLANAITAPALIAGAFAAVA